MLQREAWSDVGMMGLLRDEVETPPEESEERDRIRRDLVRVGPVGRPSWATAASAPTRGGTHISMALSS